MSVFVRRGYISTSPNAPRLPIPKICCDDRTVYINAMDILLIRKDKREEARQYLDTILPLLAPHVHREKLLKTFWETPDNSWFEFDYNTKILTYSSLEKK